MSAQALTLIYYHFFINILIFHSKLIGRMQRAGGSCGRHGLEGFRGSHLANDGNAIIGVLCQETRHVGAVMQPPAPLYGFLTAHFIGSLFLCEREPRLDGRR